VILVKLVKRNLSRTLYIVVFYCLSSFSSLKAQYGNIEFVENKGQWNNAVKFQGNVSAGAFFIRAGGFTILQHNQQDWEKISARLHGHTQDMKPVDRTQAITLRSHSWNVDFINASPTSEFKIVPDKPLDTYNNYFLGNDPSKWAGNCKIYQAITVKNIYPNVDVRYYTDKGILKYDIIVKPGADISKIALRYEGADKLELKNKELGIGTSVGEKKEAAPYSYQLNEKGRQEVNCKYVLKGNTVSFDVRNYDRNSTLVIDPVLVFCSFSGSTTDNWGFTATYGPDGSMYGGGICFANGFPVSPGAFQQNFGGGNGIYPDDIAIIKLNPNGTNRVYATYLGGTGDEQPHSLIVDPQGELIVAGRTTSSNYPTVPAGNGGLIGPGSSGNGWDIVVTKFSADGTSLIGSKRIGGTGDDGVNITPVDDHAQSLVQNYGDVGRSEVILDAAGNIYLASCTQSTDFPLLGAFQTTLKGRQDAVVLKFPPNLSTLTFSTYLGGDGDDAAYVLALHPSGDIYVAGGTSSSGPSFPGNHAGTIGTTYQGGIADGFVAQITNNGSAIIRSTFIGTSGTDQIYGIQIDNNGFPYVMGQTTGGWPHVNAVYFDNGAKQFIAKLQPDLSAYVYSTVFGKSAAIPSISPTAFLVDRCENVYVSGWGGDIFGNGAFPSSGTSGLPVTPDAFKSVSVDNADFYFFVLKKNATSQLFGSFYGQDGGFPDHVDGGTSRFDKNGVIYQAMCANCGGGVTFPTTPGVWAPNNLSVNHCNLAMLKIAFNLAGVASGVRPSINGVPRDYSGCIPLTVDFTDTIQNAVTYEWHFGDGSPVVITTAPNASHTYTATGNYLVMLVSVDSTTCNIRDTSYTHIRAGNVKAMLNFNPVKLNPCDSFKYRFDNLSTSIRPFTNTSFKWDFGDGSPRVIAGIAPVFHNYSAPGTYNVKLILTDTAYCNAPDSITAQVRVAALVKAQFQTPARGCAPYNAVFNNTSVAGQTFQWDFGDGGTSNQINPTHLYNVSGTYTITMIANDPNTCNKTDTTRFTINVFSLPKSNFNFAPDPPLENTPTTFTNLSSPDAILFFWKFGDGDTLLTTSRANVLHQYNATGSFSTCLTVSNVAGCADSVCRLVRAVVNPAVDVPNAFTPLSGDVNSKIMVRGFGISKMRFIIWNRWGQKVFETNDRFAGWDGKFKGAVQPMDVYAYTLEVEFFDGTKATKKGDITLIR
jgi:gliding motility-associated-like protein